MNTIKYSLISALTLLLISTSQTHAINGLRISVVSSNAAVTWPSTNDGSETFLVQHRGTLSATDSWSILADYLPASGSNSTTFIDVSNLIQFPTNTYSGGGSTNAALFNIVSAHTNANWQLDVYGSDYQYIGSFGGTTTDGNINVAWNLVDGNGVTHTNDTFFICVIITQYNTPSASGQPVPQGTAQAQTVTPKVYALPDPWVGHGGFVVCEQHAWDTYVNSDLLYAMLSGFNTAAQSQNWPVLLAPDSSGNPYALHYSSADSGTVSPQGDTDWANLRTALYDVRARSFFYFGHGGPNGMGYNPNTVRYITANEIGTNLFNIPAGQTNAHHFRFVFLDGCSTAKGNLVDAFGIPHKENVAGSDFANAGLRVAAFVGWNSLQSIGVNDVGGGTISINHVNFMTFFQFYLSQNDNIKDAFLYASREPGIYGYTQDSMTVYGFWGLGLATQN